MPKIAAVVVLYNPNLDVLDNINSYMNQVDKLFVIDNSEYINNSLKEKIQLNIKSEYICNNFNIGIAAALNLASKKAASEGFEYLLTVDQDSIAEPLMVEKLLNCFSLKSNIAVVSPFHLNTKGKNNIYPDKDCSEVLTAMTSGNLVKINVLNTVGGYKEDLFIDYVDHELCLRLNKMGYKVYICYKATLRHSLGDITEKNFFGIKVYPTNHSYLRCYYQTRNRFVLRKFYKELYPEFVKKDTRDFFKTILKIILFENKKRKKLEFIFYGFWDYIRNKSGKINYKVN
jgi:rhamnosyltransferase